MGSDTAMEGQALEARDNQVISEEVDSSMEFLLNKAQNLLEQNEADSRDSYWAYDACGLSRDVFQAFVECWAAPSYIDETVMPLLSALLEGVRNARREGEYADRIDDFAGNIAWRISQLKSYVEYSEMPSTATLPS